MVTELRTIEQFSGTASFSGVASSRGHRTLTIDIDASFKPDIVANIKNLRASDIPVEFHHPDLIWSSPPCETCSVASIGHHWGGGKRAYIPKSEAAKEALEVYQAALALMVDLDPRHFIIENPRGVMRKLPFMQEAALTALFGRPVVRRTVCYCKYGDTRMKPTDIWTDILDWEPRPMCHNGATDHEAAPRGAKTGTQGRAGATERARVPAALCEEVLMACEGAVQ